MELWIYCTNARRDSSVRHSYAAYASSLDGSETLRLLFVFIQGAWTGRPEQTSARPATVAVNVTRRSSTRKVFDFTKNLTLVITDVLCVIYLHLHRILCGIKLRGYMLPKSAGCWRLPYHIYLLIYSIYLSQIIISRGVFLRSLQSRLRLIYSVWNVLHDLVHMSNDMYINIWARVLLHVLKYKVYMKS